MLGLLASDGLTPVSDHDDADAIVVNTCGFLEASKQESLEVIQEAVNRKRDGRLKRIIVAGCLVQRHRAKMLEWCPDIDALIGVFDREHVVEAVRGVRPSSAPALTNGADARPAYWISGNALLAAQVQGRNVTGLTVNGRNGSGLGYFESDAARLRLTPRHYAYLRISEGCNQNCTFCTIPSIRGKMRSKPVDAILAEARELIRDGAFELNLIGQDTTSFGHDIGYAPGLSGVLTELDRMVHSEAGPAGAWLRLMYAYPSCFTDEMIDTLAALPRVLKYIDMPLQHIADPILTSMRRKTSRDLIETLLAKLRDRVPGIAIRTTFITGFPGETEEHHKELLAFIEDFGFDMLGVFKYSPEPGTPAFNLEQSSELLVDADTKQRRHDEIMALQQEIAFEQAAHLASFYKDRFDETGRPRADFSSASREELLEEIPQFDVLIDKASATSGRSTAGVSEGGQVFLGRTYFQAPQIDSMTFVHSREKLSPGELLRSVVVDSNGYDLIARPVTDLMGRHSLTIL